jgi:hypothetical protein
MAQVRAGVNSQGATRPMAAPMAVAGPGRALIDACVRLRDRFLLSVLRGCGLRVGEALGLRHEDIDARRGVITVRQRANVNRARAKTWEREGA